MTIKFPKPTHNRNKPKGGKHTAITNKCSDEVKRRASELYSYLVCERCGCSVPKIRFERAHLINASQYGSGSEPWNIAILCGPRTVTGTCHQIADETAEGMEWKARKRAELVTYYNVGDGIVVLQNVNK